jgi:Icc-related predicted phosphoesterase
MTTKKLRIAAMADIHIHQNNLGSFKDIFTLLNERADVLALCGDLTDHGHIEEAQMLISEIQVCQIPILGVLGNHDFASGQQEEIKKILSPAMLLLDEEPQEIKGVGFAGIKGFGGGFGTHMLGFFGEDGMKNFVQEAINETLKLETDLNKLQTPKKVVLMHYSPLRDTVIGEAEEIFPFLGSSRLVEPIDNFDVSAVFHGHAHFGSPEGKTLKGIPVYNVSILVRKKIKESEPFLIIEV